MERRLPATRQPAGKPHERQPIAVTAPGFEQRGKADQRTGTRHLGASLLFRCAAGTEHQRVDGVDRAPEATLFRPLETLCELGVRLYSNRLSRYVAGISLLGLAAPVSARMTVRQLARPLMEELANHICGQVQLAAGAGQELSFVKSCKEPAARYFARKSACTCHLRAQRPDGHTCRPCRSSSALAIWFNLPRVMQRARTGCAVNWRSRQELCRVRILWRPP